MIRSERQLVEHVELVIPCGLATGLFIQPVINERVAVVVSFLLLPISCLSEFVTYEL